MSDSWPPYEHVNVQLGLESWLRRSGRNHRLVGVTGFQHRVFSLADLAQDESAGHGPGLGLGSVAMANQPSGPSGQTYPCVQCALYLVEDQDGPLGVLLRGSDSRGPEQAVSLEVIAPDPDRAAARTRCRGRRRRPRRGDGSQHASRDGTGPSARRAEHNDPHPARRPRGWPGAVPRNGRTDPGGAA